MSIEPTASENSQAAQAQAADATTFLLTASNLSSTHDKGYFNVYPPQLLHLPLNGQTLLALVSDGIAWGETASMTWQGGSGALALFAMVAGTKPADAPRTAVALGDTVTVDWGNGGYTFVATAGGPTDSVVLMFSPAVPFDTLFGITVGPGAILVPRAGSQTSLTLTPDLSQAVTVAFGTPSQFPPSDFSDLTNARRITFTPTASSTGLTASASIEVNTENHIV